jgi:predicted transcriptional regulator
MSAWCVKTILQKPGLGDDFINAVNLGLTAELMRYPGFETQTITTTWTNARALQEMISKNVEALIVVSERNLIEGVIEREQIICQMMLSLVNES